MGTWLLLASVTAPALALHDPGATIDDAIVVDITEEGLASAGEFVSVLVPDSEEIPDMDECYAIIDCDGWCWLGSAEFAISNGWVSFEVTKVDIVPKEGYLDANIDIYIQVNEPSDPMSLYTEVECISDTCDVWVEPFPVMAHTTIALDIIDVDGTPTLDATVGDISAELDLGSDEIEINSCSIGTLEDVLNFFGLSIEDLIVDLISDEMDNLLADFKPELEEEIEGAFGAAVLNEDIEVDTTTVNLQMFPSDLNIDSSGLRLVMAGSSAALNQATCIADYDEGGSQETASEIPTLGDAPPSIAPGHHFGALVSDDFGNQLLYAFWRGGVLCYTLLPGGDIPLDSTILGLLAGDAFDDLFPEPVDVILQTRPRTPPTLDWAGEAAISVIVEDLGVEFYAEVDGRMAKVLDMDLALTPLVDLVYDGATTIMVAEIDLGLDAMTAEVAANEFAPDSTQAIEESFISVVDTLAGSLVDSLISDMSFTLGALEGVGLTELNLAPAGSNLDWLGAYGAAGTVEAKSVGCDDSGDCASGCTSDCGGETTCSAVGSGTSRWAAFFAPLLLVLIRRRS